MCNMVEASESRESRQRSRILEAAGRCFAKNGFKRTTIEEISSAASLSRPVLYKHFSGKEALVDAVLEHFFDEWLEEIATDEGADPDDCFSRLRGRIRGSVAFALERPVLQAILRQEPRALVSEHAESFRRCHARSLEKTRSILEQGQARGQVRASLGLDVAAQTLEMILFALVERAMGVRADYPFSPAMIETSLELAIDGLRGGLGRVCGRRESRPRRLARGTSIMTTESLPIPNGWFAVAASHEIASGDVRRARYFGRELVIFRTESGRPAVFDAYCPHLGAHLGEGGRVEGDALRCPFHGWLFDASGACRHIPYAERIPGKARARAFETLERNGFVFAWWDRDGREPWFEIPEWGEATSVDWSEPDRYEWIVRAHNQELGENGVDAAHFRYVHGTMNVPATEVSEDGAYREAYQPIEMKTPRGEVKGGIDARVFGLGFAVTRFTGICETLEFAATTPIDASRVHVRYAFTQPKVDGKSPAGGVAAAIIRDIVKQMNEDVPIWENKIYHERPVLCDGDGPIADYRRWCRQFYPDAS